MFGSISFSPNVVLPNMHQLNLGFQCINLDFGMLNYYVCKQISSYLFLEISVVKL